MVFGLLPVKDLITVSLTCREMKESITAYMKSAYAMPRLLGPFLVDDDFEGFREMLHITGGIISGSAALAFLDRQSFKPSDLDVYIPHDKCAVAEKWLLLHGLMKVTPQKTERIGTEAYARSSEIVRVDDFSARATVTVVRLISTKRDPIMAVLRFRSCMNPAHAEICN